MNSSKNMAKIAYAALEDKKGEDIVALEVGDITILADYFVIASGTNKSQVQALVASVDEALSKEGIEPTRVEGAGNDNWILMDYGDLIVHVFSQEDRLFYNLEKMWRDGKTVNKEDLGL
ncbi:MAG: ribosome silencing factor [bacterium]|nr:ribosome silencing factor [bacterium]